MADTASTGLAGALKERPELLPLLLGLVMLLVDLGYRGEVSLESFLPVTQYQVSLDMSLDGQGEEVSVVTFLPAMDERQSIVERTTRSGAFTLTEERTATGTLARWFSPDPSEHLSMGYEFKVLLSGVDYHIDEDIGIPATYPEELLSHLAATQAIQTFHPEIGQLWQQIRPPESNLVLPILRSIHDHVTLAIEGAEFKGYTDALTALRLNQASCNGKSRLFVALARLNNLPARLVGGLILDPGQKRTSHQWVEVYVQGKWIPFDPTNDHFASIPANYLSLYKGDEALFVHTRNINFDYLFDIRVRQVPGLYLPADISAASDASWLLNIFRDSGIEIEFLGTFLLLPLAALVITVCRNVFGLDSFAVFLPMLIGAACRHTGLLIGIGGFLLVVGFAALIRFSTDRMKLLHIPRLSALITIVTILILLLVWLFFEDLDASISALILFPVIILSFAAERMATMVEKTSVSEVGKLLLSTLAIIYACYLVFSSQLLETLLFLFPELLLIVLAVQIFIGRWSGLRVSEYFRFRRIFRNTFRNEVGVMGINERNRRLVDKLNRSEEIIVANDKVMSKKILSQAGIPVPKTYAIVEHYWDLRLIEKQLDHWYSFVIKPGTGSQGRGVLVVQGKDGEDFLLASDKRMSGEQLLRHLEEILTGAYSMYGDRDLALIEGLIMPTPFYQQFTRDGLTDIRVILVDGEVLAAMLRIPTSHSGGKANLHQGAIGVPIEVASGLTGNGYLSGKETGTHPDTGQQLAGHAIPNWQLILNVSKRAQRAIPLGYIGVDVVDDLTSGPVVIEVNARAGIEIQNVHGFGFQELVSSIIDRKRQIELSEPPT